MRFLLPLFGILCIVIGVSAQSQYCSSEGICIALSIPAALNMPGEAPLYLTLQAPSSSKWFAVGFGSQMAGTLMLVAWPWNNQVVVSSRLATGHILPPVYNGANIQIMSYNVTKDLTTVGLKCSNCTTWPTGMLNIQSSAADFVYAYGSTAPSKLSDPSSSFTQHDDHGNFQLDLVTAITNDDTIPPIAPQKLPSGLSTRQKIILIHGFLMGIIWVILFPLGAIIIRFLGGWVSKAAGKHRAVQITTLILLIGAGAVGFYLASGNNFKLFRISHLTSSITVDHFFGTAIIAMAIIQAVFGWYHHRRFVKDKPSHRRWFTHVHLWLGRTTIICGLANCGFGLLVANVDLRWAIIWWAGCGGLVFMYFGAYIIMRLIQRRTKVKHTGEAFGMAPTTGFAPTPYARAPVDTFEMGNPARTSERYDASYEPERERLYTERDTSLYDPPVTRPYTDNPQPYEDQPPVPRYGSPSGARQDLHLGR